MGSVYIATCQNETRTIKNFVKISSSPDDDPCESMNNVVTYSITHNITHTCYSCYSCPTSENNKRIEECLHVCFKEKRSQKIFIGEQQEKSQEHYEIPEKDAFIVLKKAIMKIYGYHVTHTSCLFCGRLSYCTTEERINERERERIVIIDPAKEREDEGRTI